VLYVDGLPVVLPNATCGVLAGEGPNAPCLSPLPSLLPGQHTLELATRITGDDGLHFATGNGGTDDRGRPADAVFRIRDKAVRPESPARREP